MCIAAQQWKKTSAWNKFSGPALNRGTERLSLSVIFGIKHGGRKAWNSSKYMIYLFFWLHLLFRVGGAPDCLSHFHWCRFLGSEIVDSSAGLLRGCRGVYQIDHSFAIFCVDILKILCCLLLFWSGQLNWWPCHQFTRQHVFKSS